MVTTKLNQINHYLVNQNVLYLQIIWNHYCLNIVTDKENFVSGVLIRAVFISKKMKD